LFVISIHQKWLIIVVKKRFKIQLFLTNRQYSFQLFSLFHFFSLLLHQKYSKIIMEISRTFYYDMMCKTKVLNVCWMVTRKCKFNTFWRSKIAFDQPIERNIDLKQWYPTKFMWRMATKLDTTSLETVSQIEYWFLYQLLSILLKFELIFVFGLELRLINFWGKAIKFKFWADKSKTLLHKKHGK
jgi:hypothetical protein